MKFPSCNIRKGLLFVISALVALQGIDAQRLISVEKELMEMTEEMADPLEITFTESKKTNLSKIRRPFNGFLYHRVAVSEFVKNTFAELRVQDQSKLHLRNRVFLI